MSAVPEFKPLCKCPAPNPCLDPRRRFQAMVFRDPARYYSHIKARHGDLLFNPMNLEANFPEFKLPGSVQGFHGSSYKFTIEEVIIYYVLKYFIKQIYVLNYYRWMKQLGLSRRFPLLNTRPLQRKLSRRSLT